MSIKYPANPSLGSKVQAFPKTQYNKIVEIIDNINGGVILNVSKNLAATSTTFAGTSTILTYGVNVFKTVTSTNYAAKLPQPTTGKSVRVVNMTSTILVLYPSNIGGQINNYPVNIPAQIPPDGRVYEFVCIENPLPGAWTWSSPATTQYDSGVITANTTSATKILMAANAANVIERSGFTSSSAWGYDGKNLPLIQNNVVDVCFKQPTQWAGITKVKVYTNLSASGLPAVFGLTSGGTTTYYDPADTTTAGIIASGSAAAGNYGGATFFGGCDQAIAGAAIPAGTLATNIGDPGTQWGEFIIVGGSSAAGSTIGDAFLGNVPNTFYSTPATLDKWVSNYLGFGIKSNYILTGFKFQFFIEHV
jgi:hypothetical protein